MDRYSHLLKKRANLVSQRKLMAAKNQKLLYADGQYLAKIAAIDEQLRAMSSTNMIDGQVVSTNQGSGTSEGTKPERTTAFDGEELR